MINKETCSPLGIFDSGLGGLSILSEIHKLLPNERIVYYADSANAPYGEKKQSQILDLCIINTQFLLSKGCKIIVVACNTATTNAIHVLRATFENIPFIGIEPAIKPAVLDSKTGKIGVLATKGTLTSQLFEKNSKKYNSNTTIIEVVGKGIVEAIESNTLTSKAFLLGLEQQLRPFKDSEIDHLVLGCSHYPLALDQIKLFLKSEVKVIDSGFAVAKQTDRILVKFGLKSEKIVKENTLQIYTNQTSNTALKSVLNKLNLRDYKIINS